MKVSTRNLLVMAALGGLTALVLLALIPFTGALAAFAPPLYALVVSVYSVLPFLARRLLGFGITATLVSLFAGLLTGAFTPIGYLALVPLLAGSLAFDLTATLLLRAKRVDRAGAGRPAGWVWVVAAAVSGVALFLVSLPVFSSDDLVPGVLLATSAARVIGQVCAALIAGVLARRLARAGLARTH
ncbi:hypothetical protein ACFVWR_02755 [Leifsonia sp. NPDC058292]|uniref:hypothetical protein n=1 Tax=Leifsonia sp. NPDC058292 TaxID=3346428 RepID=UPI0036D8F8B8